ncbi:MAG: oligosaccharide flippase family protein [Verrucomicrobia bacterium]|nr:oligosaccharide flippase family protein [Verrucomicrobiota bacterium]
MSQPRSQSIGLLGSKGSSARIKHLGAEAVLVSLGQAAAVMGGLVGVRLLTSVLPPAQYGELALGLTLATLTQQLVMGPVSSACLRFFAPAAEAGQLRAFLLGSRRLMIGATVAVCLAGLAGVVTLWVTEHRRWIPMVLVALAFSMLCGYNSVLDGIQNAARHRTVVAWHQGFGQWLRFLLALEVIGLLGSFSTAAMAGYALASAVVFASEIVFFRQRILATVTGAWHIERKQVGMWTRHLSIYAWPFAAWGVFTWAQMASDRWALQAFGGSREVGLYATLYQLGYYPMVLLSGFMVQLLSPVLFSRAGAGTDPGRMAHTYRMSWAMFIGSVAMALFGTVVAAAVHKQIFFLFAAKVYRQVSGLLPVLVLAGGLFAAGQVGVLSLLSGTETRILLAPKIGAGLCGVTANLVGARCWGLKGVAISCVVTSLFYLVWVVALVRRQSRMFDGAAVAVR